MFNLCQVILSSLNQYFKFSYETSHLAQESADVILIHKSGCLAMKRVYHLVLGVLLSLNIFLTFNLLSNSSTLSSMSVLV